MSSYLKSVQGSGYKVIPRLRECRRLSQAKVVRKSRNNIHQTRGLPFNRALYLACSLAHLLLLAIWHPPSLLAAGGKEGGRAVARRRRHSACFLFPPPFLLPRLSADPFYWIEVSIRVLMNLRAVLLSLFPNWLLNINMLSDRNFTPQKFFSSTHVICQTSYLFTYCGYGH